MLGDRQIRWPALNHTIGLFQANTRNSPNAVSMLLAHRLRRWPTLKQQWVNISYLLGYDLCLPIPCEIDLMVDQCESSCPHIKPSLHRFKGGGPRVVVSTAAFHARVRGLVPGLGGLKETKMFLPHTRVKVSIVGSLRDREVACSASDRQGTNFESCVWRTVSSPSSHHPQDVLLAQFSLYVHKGGLRPDSFHFHRFNVACSQNIWEFNF